MNQQKSTITEKKQENTKNPSIVEFVEEQDYNDDEKWNYYPIKDAWGHR